MTIPDKYKPWPGFTFKYTHIHRNEKETREYVVLYPSNHCVVVKDTSNGIKTSFRYDELIKAGVINRVAGYPGYCIDKNETNIGRK